MEIILLFLIAMINLTGFVSLGLIVFAKLSIIEEQLNHIGQVRQKSNFLLLEE